jgi:hypothetical protein
VNNRSLSRKIIYILAMVALLFPLFYLGKPPTKGSGKIAELRSRYSIGQADLGKLDPASESMKLATLGLRGIAATILWLQAHSLLSQRPRKYQFRLGPLYRLCSRIHRLA